MFKICTYTLITVLIVNLLATSGDVSLTWTSPILPKLYSNNSEINPMGQPITQMEESWIASIINIGAMIGPLPFGFMSKKIGRKISLLSLAICYIITFFILSVFHNFYAYFFARLLAGVAIGAGVSLLSLYVAEISEDSNRGMLTVTINVFWTLGDMLPYVLGPYLPVVWFNVTLATLPALFFVLFLLIGPESPYYLIENNQLEKAEHVFQKLRPTTSSSIIKKEVLSIHSTMQKQEDSCLEIFKTKHNLKALGIALMLVAFQQFSGISAILFYTQLIFEVSGSHLPSEISSIIIGLVFFLSSIIMPFIADRFGRKFFLIISAFGMTVSLSILGGYFYMQELAFDVSSFQWLPLVCLVSYMITNNLGFGSIVWTISSEIFSTNVKPFGTALVSLNYWVTSFLVTKFFNDLNYTLGRAGTFWFFSACSFLAALFAQFCVPETQGKSFAEIQKLLAQ